MTAVKIFSFFVGPQNKPIIIMGVEVPVIILTIFWGLIGGVAPFIIPKGPNKG